MAKPPTRMALGRGLAALIPAAAEPPAATAGDAVLELDIDLVAPSPDQPRKRFVPEELAELASSIREQGVISPIIVREEGGRYELVAGERRWRAAQQAGLRKVPAIVRRLGRQRALEIALVENIQRAGLNPIEEANAYQLLGEQFGMSAEDIGRRVGKDRSTVVNSLRLLKLSMPVKQLVVEGRISGGHARALLGIAVDAERERLAARIVAKGLTVRDVERAAARAKSGEADAEPEAPAPPPTADVFLKSAEERLQKSLGTRVRIERSGKGGRIAIEFYSDEELTRLYDRLARS